MADNSSEEKTEKPSAQKLRKARQEGQIPRSKDMGLAASLFAAYGDLQQLSLVRRFRA